AFVGDEGADSQKELFPPVGPGTEEVHVHRRVADRRFPPVMAADPFGHGRGVGEIARRASGRLLVPAAQPAYGKGLQGSPARATRRKVCLELVVSVTNRRVAVAEVGNAGWRDCSLGYAMGGRDDQIESPQVERFDGPGKEREVVPVVPPG